MLGQQLVSSYSSHSTSISWQKRRKPAYISRLTTLYSRCSARNSTNGARCGSSAGITTCGARRALSDRAAIPVLGRIPAQRRGRRVGASGERDGQDVRQSVSVARDTIDTPAASPRLCPCPVSSGQALPGVKQTEEANVSRTQGRASRARAFASPPTASHLDLCASILCFPMSPLTLPALVKLRLRRPPRAAPHPLPPRCAALIARPPL